MSAYLMPTDEGRRIVLNKAIIFIGRHPECDVVLTRSRKISRKHCCIALVNDSFVIRDLGSMNGVHVNGKRVENEARLRIGDTLAIGDCQYVLNSSGAKNQKSASDDNGSDEKNDSALPLNTDENAPIPFIKSDEAVVASPLQPITPDAIPLDKIDDDSESSANPLDGEEVDGDELKDSGSHFELMPE